MTEDIRSIDPFEIKTPMMRQRKEFVPAKLKELADSIYEVGQIQPIVVDSNFILIAGERRLKAIKSILQNREAYENWQDFENVKI